MSYRFIDEKKQHLHTLDGQPLFGTSTVVKEVMPPFLAKWGAQCAVDFLKENPGQFDKAVMAWSTVRKEKADIGTDMHSALEEYVKWCLADGGTPREYPGDNKHVKEFAEWAVSHAKRFLYSEVYVYSKELWLGGVIDVVLELNDGRHVIGDFKSSPQAYMNQFFQIALYDLQQAENGFMTATGDKVGDPLPISAYFVYAFRDGMTAHEYVNMEGIREGAKAILTIYKLLP